MEKKPNKKPAPLNSDAQPTPRPDRLDLQPWDMSGWAKAIHDQRKAAAVIAMELLPDGTFNLGASSDNLHLNRTMAEMLNRLMQVAFHESEAARLRAELQGPTE